MPRAEPAPDVGHEHSLTERQDDQPFPFKYQLRGDVQHVREHLTDGSSAKSGAKYAI